MTLIKEKNKGITCKMFYLLVYISAVWESDAENHIITCRKR